MSASAGGFIPGSGRGRAHAREPRERAGAGRPHLRRARRARRGQLRRPPHGRQHDGAESRTSVAALHPGGASPTAEITPAARSTRSTATSPRPVRRPASEVSSRGSRALGPRDRTTFPRDHGDQVASSATLSERPEAIESVATIADAGAAASSNRRSIAEDVHPEIQPLRRRPFRTTLMRGARTSRCIDEVGLRIRGRQRMPGIQVLRGEVLEGAGGPPRWRAPIGSNHHGLAERVSARGVVCRWSESGCDGAGGQDSHSLGSRIEGRARPRCR